MPSILQQGYGPALGYMSETGSLLGGSSPAKHPGRPPLPMAQVQAPNYQGAAAGYRQRQAQADAANTQAGVSLASLALILALT